MCPDDPEKSLNDEVTFAGAAKHRPASADVSLGDERTRSDSLSGQDTVIDDGEAVDLEARYKIEGTLGQGGMGTVLLATDTRLGRKVAIKRILGEAAGNKMAVARFLTEAKSIAALNHPNVVHIYEFGRTQAGPFLIMEYVDGGSLLDRCKTAPIELDDAIELVCQICVGLAKTHSQGIIHRDIKPSNILLTGDGIPKLADFGLAKADVAEHQVTASRAVMGTPEFMPPEQQRDMSLVDHRSDLWSLAAVLYQMVSGRSPKVIRLHELPKRLQPVLSRALEDEKQARYQSALAFREALLRIGEEAGRKNAPAQFGGVLQEGQCKACGMVTSDLTKKFCRSPQCGASLRVACLKCETQIPVWDGVCGECGGNQPALLEMKREEFAAKRAEAEALVAALNFDEAIDLVEAIAGESHEELAECTEWAKAFVASTVSERERQRANARERLRDAQRHRSQFDYTAAIQSLESIPERFRDAAATVLLSECNTRRDESATLINEIARRIKHKEIDGLVPLVRRAIDLRGDRADLANIYGKLIARCDTRLANAKNAYMAGDARAAEAALDNAVAEDYEQPSALSLADIRNAGALERRIYDGVKAAKATGVITAATAKQLLTDCERCLEVHGTNILAKRIASQCRRQIARIQRHAAKEDTKAPAAVPTRARLDLSTRVGYGIEISNEYLRSVVCPESWDGGPDGAWSPTLGPCTPATIVIHPEKGPLAGTAAVSASLQSDVVVITGFLDLLWRRPLNIPESWLRSDDAVPATNDAGEPTLVAAGSRFRLSDLASLLLQKAMSPGERQTAACVIAVPGACGTLARDSLLVASQAAGIKIRRLVTTTHAEAVACYWHELLRGKAQRNGVHLIVHWDETCCEATVYESADGVISILSTASDTSLGATRWRQRLVEHLLREAGVGDRAAIIDGLASRWIWGLAESAHVHLRDETEYDVIVPIYGTAAIASELRKVCVTRANYESLCPDLFLGINRLICQALKDAKREPADFTGEIYLTGPEVRAPAFLAVVSQLFPKKAISALACPEHMASWGAALLGAVFNGDIQDLLLLQSCCFSIGVETEGGVMTKLVERNTKTPTERKQLFLPTEPSEATVSVRVYEGEHPMAVDNSLIGEFAYVRAANSDHDVDQEVMIDLDADGLVTVRAGPLGAPLVTHLLPYFQKLTGHLCSLRAEEHEDEGCFDEAE